MSGRDMSELIRHLTLSLKTQSYTLTAPERDFLISVLKKHKELRRESIHRQIISERAYLKTVSSI